MDITFLLWAAIAVEFFAVLAVDLANRKLRRHQESFEHMVLAGFTDLGWQAVKDAAKGDGVIRYKSK